MFNTILFIDLPLNELDVLALTELTYLPFDDLLDQPVNRLSDVATRVPRESTMLTNKERLHFRPACPTQTF